MNRTEQAQLINMIDTLDLVPVEFDFDKETVLVLDPWGRLFGLTFKVIKKIYCKVLSGQVPREYYVKVKSKH